MRTSDTTIGIDVSKAKLDVCFLPDKRHIQLDNDPKGIAALVSLAKAAKPSLLVFEPSGGYERAMQNALISQQLPCAKVNARKIREFAKCTGQIAKTDAIDAGVLAQYGAVIKPEHLRQETTDLILDDLVKRRRQLVDMMVSEKNRIEKKPSDAVQVSIHHHITYLEQQVSLLDKQINSHITSCESLAPKAKILSTFKGVGKQTIAILLADLPELGQLTGGQVASLAGLAPHNKDSGLMRGKRTISGGRAAVRKVLYMATMTAIRQDGFVRDFYIRLIQRGKPGKVALTAAMRKFLVHINAVMRDEFYA